MSAKVVAVPQASWSQTSATSSMTSSQTIIKRCRMPCCFILIVLITASTLLGTVPFQQDCHEAQFAFDTCSYDHSNYTLVAIPVPQLQCQTCVKSVTSRTTRRCRSCPSSGGSSSGSCNTVGCHAKSRCRRCTFTETRNVKYDCNCTTTYWDKIMLEAQVPKNITVFHRNSTIAAYNVSARMFCNQGDRECVDVLKFSGLRPCRMYDRLDTYTKLWHADDTPIDTLCAASPYAIMAYSIVPIFSVCGLLSWLVLSRNARRARLESADRLAWA